MATRPRSTPQDGTFFSPHQPPPGLADFLSDVDEAEDPGAYRHIAHMADLQLRFRTPDPKAVPTLVTALSQYNTNRQLAGQITVRFVIQHVHPDDQPQLIARLVDPDSGVDVDELLKQIARAGTSRPFGRYRHSPPRQ